MLYIREVFLAGIVQERLHKRGCRGRCELLPLFILLMIIHSLFIYFPISLSISPIPSSLHSSFPQFLFFSALLHLSSPLSLLGVLFCPFFSLPFPLVPLPLRPADDVFSYYRVRLRGNRGTREGGLDKREGEKGRWMREEG